MGEKEHLFMGCNGYSCTDKHKTDADCNSDGNWADIEAPLPKTERRPMTQGCTDAMDALASAAGGKFQGAVALMKTPAADWKKSPLEMIGCAKDATRGEMKTGLNLFLAAAEICPEYCIPGTDTDHRPREYRRNHLLCFGHQRNLCSRRFVHSAEGEPQRHPSLQEYWHWWPIRSRHFHNHVRLGNEHCQRLVRWCPKRCSVSLCLVRIIRKFK